MDELDVLRKVNQFLCQKLVEEFQYNAEIRQSADAFYFSKKNYFAAR